ncbi:pyridoxal 5'-phosphate synthase subunit PdxT [Aeropyrum pernix]|uniref:Pyridoxal 5'-phosphate synthase subunit PdxT n=1 Tax=Aeropyrum pernix TaxID=56636 RepID=A0A401HB72_AERPX|nr:pyridoxal 5'-phosphate synthase glutaminase subunit PdxT [Aeropyrum pernix]GBF09654.1 pyridoxal 5'-phosphate synthase subunit PdxT [Aeropyrum pernix]
MRIGVLGYQGGVYEHVYMLRRSFDRLGVHGEAVVVKKPEDLKGLDGVIIPGGESTTIGILAKRLGVLEPLREQVLNGLPAMGTCAGAIILAGKVRDKVVGEKSQPLLGVMRVEVVRNFFGRQRESFEADLEIEGLDRRFRGVFIRSPAITAAESPARIISWLDYNGQRVGVAAVQGPLLATSFHPELTGDTRLHELWLRLVKR